MNIHYTKAIPFTTLFLSLFSSRPIIFWIDQLYSFWMIRLDFGLNGRRGRLVNALYLVQQDLLSQLVLNLSSYMIKFKTEYYQLVGGVTDENNWPHWMKYLVTALIETAQITFFQQ